MDMLKGQMAPEDQKVFGREGGREGVGGRGERRDRVGVDTHEHGHAQGADGT